MNLAAELKYRRRSSRNNLQRQATGCMNKSQYFGHGVQPALLTNMSISCLALCLSHIGTHTHSHFILQCLPPPCGEKTIAAATDLSFQAATKERPPSVAGLYALFLMGQQKYHLFRPCKDSTRRAHTKPAKLPEIFYPFSRFGSDVSCVPVNSDVTMNVPLCPGSTVGHCQVSGHISD